MHQPEQRYKAMQKWQQDTQASAKKSSESCPHSPTKHKWQSATPRGQTAAAPPSPATKTAAASSSPTRSRSAAFSNVDTSLKIQNWTANCGNGTAGETAVSTYKKSFEDNQLDVMVIHFQEASLDATIQELERAFGTEYQITVGDFRRTATKASELTKKTKRNV